MEFDDGLINFKILFLKVEKVPSYSKSKLFHSMAVDGKKLFGTEMANVIISSLIIYFANARNYFEKTLRILTFKYFEKVPEFPIPSYS